MEDEEEEEEEQEMRKAEQTKVELETVVHQSSRARCTLVQIDGVKLLLDCGWDTSAGSTQLSSLADIAPEVSAVLLSQPSLEHAGGVPYARSYLGLRCPVYCTLPVHKFGMLSLYDYYQNMRLQSDFDTFTLDDVDAAFHNFVTLRYTQRTPIGRKDSDLLATPRSSGFQLGGTVWEISKNAEYIVYMPDFNHRKERILSAASLENVYRPSLVIADASMARANEAPPLEQRDKSMLQSVHRCLKADGTVLIPCDTTGRVFELLLVLSHGFDDKGSNAVSKQYHVVLFNSVASTAIEFANTHTEWMNDSLVQNINTSKGLFPHASVTSCHSMEQFNELPAGPKVVLATAEDLEIGPARALATVIAGSITNLVLFPRQPPSNTFASSLVEQSQKPMAQRNQLSVDVSWRVDLEGEELAEYERKQREEQARQSRAMHVGSAFNEADTEVMSTSGIVGNKAESTASAATNRHSSQSSVKRESEERTRVDTAANSSDNQNDSNDGRRDSKATKRRHGATSSSSRAHYEASFENGGQFDVKSTDTAAANKQQLVLPTDDDMDDDADDGRIGSDLVVGAQCSEHLMADGRREPLIDGFEPDYNDEGPMFPQRESKAAGPQTAYGIAADMDALQQLWRAAGSAGGSTSAALLEEGPAEDENWDGAADSDIKQLQSPEDVEVMQYIERPSKVISQTFGVNVHCAVHVLQYDGKADGRSLRTMITKMEPQKCAIIGGARDGKMLLRTTLQYEGVTVKEPTPGEMMDVSSNTAIFSVKLPEAFLRSVDFQHMGEYDVAYIEGMLQASQTESMRTLQPTSSKAMHTSGSSVFIGDMKLSELKSALNAKNMEAEFSEAGVLHCGATTKLRLEGSELTVDGCASDEMHAIRGLIYDKYKAV